MKTNDAPKKIWINPTTDLPKLNGVMDKNSVEYTRTDAFIEKACNTYCRLCDTKECGDTGECDWVEKFRKRLMK